MRPARWRKKIAVGTAKTPRARRFSYFFLCVLCAFAVQISGTARVGRPRSGREYTNARMRPARWRKFPTYRESGGWNRQDAKSAKVFLLFLSFASFAPLRFKSPKPPKQAVHEAGANTRMHECARPGGARKSRLEPPRRHGREGFLTFSFASFAPLRFPPDLLRLFERQHEAKGCPHAVLTFHP